MNRGAKKKPRTIYSPQQVLFLEESFAEQDFPNRREREDIARKLEMTEHHVQIWFQNKRAKRRRKEKKRAQFESFVTTPKAPSFWPHNLSFNSDLKEVQPHSVQLTTTLSLCPSSMSSSSSFTETKASGHINGHQSSYKLSSEPLTTHTNYHQDGQHSLPKTVSTKLSSKYFQGSFSELECDCIVAYTSNNSRTFSPSNMPCNGFEQPQSTLNKRSKLEEDEIKFSISVTQNSNELSCLNKSGADTLTDPMINPLLLLADCATARL